MAHRVRYYYDAESCTYREEEISLKDILKTIAIHFSVGTVLAVVLFAAYFYMWDDPKVAVVKKQNKQLFSKIEEYKSMYTSLESRVDSLKRKDDELYRSILQQEPIPEGVWAGGRGGDANHEISSQPAAIKETEQKLDVLMSKVNTLNKGYDYILKLFKENEERLKHLPAMRPIDGLLISGYGLRKHPIYKIQKLHKGIDFAARTGTPVYATGDGVVKFAGVKGNGFGIYVDVDHGYGFVSRYAHLSKLKVKQGGKVKRGDKVGLSGSTGLSKGPHLHYEILKSGTQINPIDYFCDLTPDEFHKMKNQVDNETDQTESMD